MAHFAQLDATNTVTRVIVVSNAACKDADGVECEAIGAALCESLHGGRWIQTSYNGSIRKNFAGVGYRYDAERDAFIPPQPYPSWTLNARCRWSAPVPHPAGVSMCRWDEAAGQWVPVTAA